MTNSDEAIRELSQKYGGSIIVGYGQPSGSGTIPVITAEEQCFTDLTALISEHYVAKEEVDKMVAEKCKKCKYRGLPDSIQEALNSGDGVYRP